MKNYLQHKTLWGGVLIVITLVCIIANGLVYSVFIEDFGAHTLAEEVNNSEVRSRLLTQALDEVGVCSPQQAAIVWANGLQERSAALQYAVMTSALKKDYAQQLEKNFPNWVTGLSSPWVETFKIKHSNRLAHNRYAFELRFSTETSQGPAGDYIATVTVDREGDFWRITKIEADEELFPYTGYKSQ